MRRGYLDVPYRDTGLVPIRESAAKCPSLFTLLLFLVPFFLLLLLVHRHRDDDDREPTRREGTNRSPLRRRGTSSTIYELAWTRAFIPDSASVLDTEMTDPAVTVLLPLGYARVLR